MEKKQRMQTRFNEEFMYSTHKTFLTLSTFNKLTFDKLTSLTGKYMSEILNIRRDNFEEFWILIQKMKAELIKKP